MLTKHRFLAAIVCSSFGMNLKKTNENKNVVFVVFGIVIGGYLLQSAT
jgi:hypothetical protein